MKEAHAALLDQFGGALPRIEGRIRLEVVVRFATRAKADLDNRVKALQDAIKDDVRTAWVGIFKDDSQIDDLHVWRDPIPKKPGTITIFVCSIDRVLLPWWYIEKEP